MTNLIKIYAIPDYVYKLTGKRVSPQTVYRWIHIGKLNWQKCLVKLEIKTVLGQLYSTKEFIDAFLEDLI